MTIVNEIVGKNKLNSFVFMFKDVFSDNPCYFAECGEIDLDEGMDLNRLQKLSCILYISALLTEKLCERFVSEWRGIVCLKELEDFRLI
jgi:hypothetical protein